MAHNRSYKPEDIAFPDQVITESHLVEEMEKSYIEYAMSVIVGRALPDVRDGLKPVHRRILYTMYESGLTSDKPFKKSATCVGDVLGKYHPHGDASVYDAMVRLAQDFSMRYLLVDGHGNFGSVDGDPPAAYRYTEARLSKISNEMLRDIDKDTVDWDPNFDETRKEPRVLPSRFPNLLVNGSSGIAVGMATNIPPHNLTEVINACICVLDDPECTLVNLMDHITGPDFPTGGIIMGRSGIRAAYATGRGKVIVRAKTEFEEFGKDRTRIIVTELPYQVNKRQLIKTIADQVKDKRLDGISDLRDETDRNGMRMVIELKKDANPQVVLNNLFKQTALQSNFSIIMLALVDNQKQPKILSLRQILDEYLKYQEEVLTRRTQYDLRKAQERAHLLEGLLIAQDNIDEVIHIIRSSYDNAKQNLMERFNLDDVQAQAICDMRLIALQGLNREKLEAEYKELEQKIAYYQELLADESKLRGVLRQELVEIRDKFGDERKTVIQDIEDEIDIEDLIEEETCAFTLSNHGYIKRMPVDTYRTQSRGGRGVNAQNLKEEDYVKSLNIASTHDYILFFTDSGKVHLRKGYQIPEAGRTARGTAIVNVLPLEAGETVTAMVVTREFHDNEYLLMATRKGVVKRLPFVALKTNRKGGIRALTLEEDDHLINVLRTNGDDNIILATAQGMAICFNETDVRCMGRDAAGVRGVSLNDGDYVVGAQKAESGKTLLTVTENGYGKRTELPEYLRTGPDGEKIPQSRGGKGLKNYNITAKTGAVAGCCVVGEQDDVMLIENGGVIIRVPASSINVYKRDVQGVIVMRIDEGNKVVSIERVEQEEEEPADTQETQE
ncbi:DNA gyrase subunit A [Pseudoflavonifractor sp. MSJ-30]|uniref:DNA gyrase subunit A n=1 Tax=Pseudoflavonifractor sp. MSJ-30 TaxID=2841525 RepID=UPI001C123B41|nr:DNA gyrase subunit A [Pseudoflavonifractor sp. MSJ-30]MBU5453773.1 DNA gyrase subunit A [Pseudoflavonifractor sp. MSJ-30]